MSSPIGIERVILVVLDGLRPDAIPWIFRGIALRLSKALGVADPNFVGQNAHDVVFAAKHGLADTRRGVILLHLPDADCAGHEHGWMSEEYLAAAHKLDAALGLVSAFGFVDEGPATLLIAFADHGGGGTSPRDHDSPHPLNATIPLLVSGECVQHGTLDQQASLLDVPATVLWSFGVPVPSSYAGKPLLGAFKQIPVAA